MAGPRETFADLLSKPILNIINRQEGTAYCSIEQVRADILTRPKGKSSFTNVTAELLTIVFRVSYEDDAGDIQTVDVRVPIFSSILDGEYWEYDNNGLRLAQVRFYDCSTNVETGDSTC